jgi:DNA-binding CsgD family transcriptional regulator
MVRVIKSLSVDDAPVLERLAGQLREFFRMDTFVAFNVLPGPRGFAMDFLFTAGLTPEDEQLLRCLVAHRPDSWGPFAFLGADDGRRNRAENLPPSSTAPAQFHDPACVILEELGLNRQNQLRALICDGHDVLAWVGGFRAQPFSGREQFLLGALVPSLIPRLSWERSEKSAQVLMAGLTAVLEAVPFASFVVRESEAIVFANDAGRELLRDGRGEVALLMRNNGAIEAAPGFDLKPLRTPGFEPHYLVTHSQQNLQPRVMALRSAWGLTGRQVDVLGLLVQGEPNRAIATKLGCALRTAELHVSKVLKKAGVSSRSELTARFWAS